MRNTPERAACRFSETFPDCIQRGSWEGIFRRPEELIGNQPSHKQDNNSYDKHVGSVSVELAQNSRAEDEVLLYS